MMRTIRLSRRTQALHVEAPGCIVNIETTYTDPEGRPFVRVEAMADRDRYSGEEWWLTRGRLGPRGTVAIITQAPLADLYPQGEAGDVTLDVEPDGAGWTVDAGRCLVFDGTPLFTLHGLSDAAGYRYHPAELDALTHRIAEALNACNVDGSKVAR